MERADVLIVGGGPAGSSCAARLVAAGVDVLLLDAARFPRDKPCAGWITPEVLGRLALDPDEYGAQQVIQALSAFRVGFVGGEAVDVDYGSPVSYAIRRCEFDAALLRRSRVACRLGERVREIRREAGCWNVDGRWSAPMLVGAGGQFCPVARLLRGAAPGSQPVVAREIEYRLDARSRSACRVESERAELYFCRDLLGYGWCVRKGDFLNVGLGRRVGSRLPRHVTAFVEFLVRSGRLAEPPAQGWRGHAYRVREGAGIVTGDTDAVLVGDAAGLAFPESGEGILPAVVSGQLAAEAILEPGGCGAYPERLAEHLGRPRRGPAIPGTLAALAARLLLGRPWLVRRVVLDRWFLHRSRGGGASASEPRFRQRAA